MPRMKSTVSRPQLTRLPVPRLLLAAFVLSTGCDQDQDGDGWTIQDGDCDDAAAEVHPEAPEVCNGTDDDCDGLIDADDPSLAPWYRDSDGDGSGSTDQSIRACPAPQVTWLSRATATTPTRRSIPERSSAVTAGTTTAPAGRWPGPRHARDPE